MSIKDLEFKVSESWKKVANENSWKAFIPEFAKDSNGQKYMRRKGNSNIYKIISEDDQGKFFAECSECESKIISETIAHSIHDGPFPLSGSGKCRYEKIPYCSNCEEKPHYHGNSINIPF